MNEERIKQLVEEKRLIPREKDIPRIKSMIASAEQIATVAKKMELNDENATVIFKETYDAIRQLGDARWRLNGYEVFNSHGLSMELLREEPIKESAQLQKLEQFREIRRSASYQGYSVVAEQAKAILDFWEACGKEILERLKKDTQ